mgnify:CR=1 FL=1
MCSKLALCIAISMLGMSFIASAVIPIIVKVAVGKQTATFYQSTLKQKQKTALEFTSIDMKITNRAFISLVIFVQALDRAELAVNLELVHSPNPKRGDDLVQNGDVLLSMRTLEKGYTPKGMFKSTPLISAKNNLKGIYGLKSNHALMKVKAVEDLRKFSAVIGRGWQPDIKLL